MTEREKELEELRYILLISSKMCAQMEADECEFVAQKIQEAGYTKKHFPVEKLKKWLEEEIIKHKGYFHDYGTILKKVKELEDGT